MDKLENYLTYRGLDVLRARVKALGHRTQGTSRKWNCDHCKATLDDGGGVFKKGTFWIQDEWYWDGIKFIHLCEDGGTRGSTVLNQVHS